MVTPARCADPHRHLHIQIGTRVWAAGKWRGLDGVALSRQQGAIRALGTAVIAAHPDLAAAVESRGLTLDHVTGEATELEPFNALMSKRGPQVAKNLAALVLRSRRIGAGSSGPGDRGRPGRPARRGRPDTASRSGSAR
ncbi:MAG: relaxase domain-containing protein [Frankiaceae bacterium]|nr:relaxase domain-containing protein [Frankiaceae bacterium]